MAEGARFELADPLRGLQFSRLARSATPSPLRMLGVMRFQQILRIGSFEILAKSAASTVFNSAESVFSGALFRRLSSSIKSEYTSNLIPILLCPSRRDLGYAKGCLRLTQFFSHAAFQTV